MKELQEKEIRAAFVNTTQGERKNIVMPAHLGEINWETLTYLGWRDPKNPLLGFIVAEVDGEPVGIMLRQTETRPRSRAQCSWCEDVHLPNDVVFFSARRAGRAGRAGNTVGTLACEEFNCNRNVRALPALAYVGFDREAERERRIASLQKRVSAFARGIRDSE
ncbi:FBP domain-containing protein [Mycetocola tolaasinivorans]|uniref:FBP domain-containing protein n=1 Tax=Mycetocola tolaasinivorans TaxID=76635 RepID=A0A3L7A1V6_9MICO|nr:FBP domain-containing protein [Mycetocola tolaasinivorans]RLP74137.1 FBP domain-containing protein [Mycetocola tolaasinivorans]